MSNTFPSSEKFVKNFKFSIAHIAIKELLLKVSSKKIQALILNVPTNTGWLNIQNFNYFKMEYIDN